jgi:hypothetical protein
MYVNLVIEKTFVLNCVPDNLLNKCVKSVYKPLLDIVGNNMCNIKRTHMDARVFTIVCPKHSYGPLGNTTVMNLYQRV